MARFKIYSKDGSVVKYEGKPRYIGSYLKPSHLEFSEIASPTLIQWEVGDYIDYPRTGLRYYLYSIPQASKSARKETYGGAFVYSGVQFYAATKELEIAPFRDLVIEDNYIHFSTSPDVATFENVEGIARRIQSCMDEMYPSRWRIEVASGADSASVSEAKDFALSGGTCLDALSKIYEMWPEVGWFHSVEGGVNVITIGYSVQRTDGNTTDEYLYGKGKGLTAIKKNQTNKDEFATRLYVFGSERNLPSRYYNDLAIANAESVDIRNLMLPLDQWGTTNGLPDARKAYLENAEAVARYGVIPRTHYFDSEEAGADIYPSLEGMTIGQIRKALSDMGETKYYPSTSIYPNDAERVDEIKSVSNPSDDGVMNRHGKSYDAIQYFTWDDIDQFQQINKEDNTFSFTPYVLANVKFDIEDGRITFKTDGDVEGFLTDYGQISNAELVVEITDSITKIKEFSEQYRLSLPSAVNNQRKFSLPKKMTFSCAMAGGISLYVLVYVRGELNNLTEGFECDYRVNSGVCSIEVKENLPKEFNLTLKQLGFDINERASQGEGKTISMKSGMCEGRNFEILDCIYDSKADAWDLTCARQQDDTLGMLFPNSTYPLASGDKIVLLDIAMPEVYIRAGMERVLSEGQKLLAKASRMQCNYEPSIDAKLMAESGRSLREGMYMELTDEDVVDSGKEYILIDTLSIYEDESAIPTYKVTLKEKRKVTYKGTPSATSPTSTKSAKEDDPTDIDLSDYATKSYVKSAISMAGIGGSVEIDTEMSDTSENAVQNKVIKAYADKHPQYEVIEEVEAPDNIDDTIILDDAMSDTSENGVKNKVIKKYVDDHDKELSDKYDGLAHLKDMFYWEDEAKTTIGTKYPLFSEQTLTAGGKKDESSEGTTGGLDQDALEEYLAENKYTTETWVNQQGFAKDADLNSLESRVDTLENNSGGNDGSTETPTVVVDDAMSDSSTNPVQNKVIKEYVDSNISDVNDSIAEVAQVLDWFEYDSTEGMIKAKFGLYSEGAISAGGIGEGGSTSGTTPDLDGYATEEWVQDQGYATEEWVSGKDYATNTAVNALDNRVKALEDSGVSGGDGTTSDVDLSEYAKMQWVEDQNYATKTEVEDAIAEVNGDITKVTEDVAEANEKVDTVLTWFEYDAESDMIRAKYGLYSDGAISAGGKNGTSSEDTTTPSATALTELEDVSISSPSNGQALVYDSTAKKWKNATVSTSSAEITSSDVVDALGYTPMNDTDFNQQNIQSELGISDWALEGEKPSYKYSEIEERPTKLTDLENDLELGGLATKDAISYDEIEDKPATLAEHNYLDAVYYSTGIGNTEYNKLGYSDIFKAAMIAFGRIDAPAAIRLNKTDENTHINMEVRTQFEEVTITDRVVTKNATEDGDITFEKIHIGDATLSWDEDAQMLKFDKGIYSVGAVTAGGKGTSYTYQFTDWDDWVEDEDGNLTDSKLEDYVLSARLGVELNERLTAIEEGNNLKIDFDGLNKLIDTDASASDLAAIGLTSDAIERLLDAKYVKVIHNGSDRQVWDYTAYENGADKFIFFRRGDGFNIHDGYSLEYNSSTKVWTISMGEI